MRTLRLRSGILDEDESLAAKVKLVEVTRDQIFLSSLYKNCFAILECCDVTGSPGEIRLTERSRSESASYAGNEIFYLSIEGRNHACVRQFPYKAF